jgi:uncharacterized membrane-anchored protein YitT (DUF2179 family)
MKLYRIYTERKNIKGVKNILDGLFNGYTLIKADGRWKGTDEASLIIEVVSAECFSVMSAVHQIKSLPKRSETCHLGNIKST